MNRKTTLTKNEALIKLQKYCAYQDRCHSEVRSKLLDLGMYGDELEEIISDLIQERFLNEERFAQSYVRGKFNTKHWGRHKIVQALKQKSVSAYCINKGLKEIEDARYQEVLELVLEKKIRTTKGKNRYEIKQKTANYGIRRGFEAEFIWSILDRIYPL